MVEKKIKKNQKELRRQRRMIQIVDEQHKDLEEVEEKKVVEEVEEKKVEEVEKKVEEVEKKPKRKYNKKTKTT